MHTKQDQKQNVNTIKGKDEENYATIALNQAVNDIKLYLTDNENVICPDKLLQFAALKLNSLIIYYFRIAEWRYLS